MSNLKERAAEWCLLTGMQKADELFTGTQIIRDLLAENEALRMDAERYRWLKESRFYRRTGLHMDGTSFVSIGGASLGRHRDLDAAIDFAIAKERGE